MTEENLITDEADPQSLADLFAADPENLTDNDVNRIVAEYREKRKLFLQEEQTKSLKGSTKKGYKDAPPDLNLEDILI